jgi:hypothetical protein
MAQPARHPKRKIAVLGSRSVGECRRRARRGRREEASAGRRGRCVAALRGAAREAAARCGQREATTQGLCEAQVQVRRLVCVGSPGVPRHRLSLRSATGRRRSGCERRRARVGGLACERRDAGQRGGGAGSEEGALVAGLSAARRRLRWRPREAAGGRPALLADRDGWPTARQIWSPPGVHTAPAAPAWAAHRMLPCSRSLL